MDGVRLFKSGVMTSEAAARAGYQAMKVGSRVIIPGTRNKVMALSAKLSPRGLTAKVAHYLSKV